MLTTGEAGMRSQALGLAEAVGLPIEEKRFALRAPWKWLPGGLVADAVYPCSNLAAIRSAPPWPLLVVACGRRSIGAGARREATSRRARRSPSTCRTPSSGVQKFDLVAAMPHDGVTGRNVIVSKRRFMA